MYLVLLGGLVGTLVRFALTVLCHSNVLPWATFIANISGCFMIGWFTSYAMSLELSHLWVTGFCGALTSMSSLAFENILTCESGNISGTIAYTVSSVFLGLLVTALGTWIGKNT